MKKIFEKILTVVFILILGYQQFCYADVIVKTIDPLDEFKPKAVVVGFIGIIVLIVTSISFFTLKSTINKQEKDNSKKVNDEKIEKKQNRIQRTFYVWGIILSIVIIRYTALSEEISGIVFLIPIILFVTSFIVRLNKEEKKMSNIICGVAIILVCIIALYGNISNKISNKIIEKNNQQFLQYIYYSGDATDDYRTNNVEGLINTAIEKNNKDDRTIMIEYRGEWYKSLGDLKHLLNQLNVEAEYEVELDYNYDDEITSISLYPIIDIDDKDEIMTSIKECEGVSKKGSEVKSLIREVCPKIQKWGGALETVDIVYIPEPDQKTTICLNDITLQEYIYLEDKIKDEETYDVEFKIDLIITRNN